MRMISSALALVALVALVACSGPEPASSEPRATTFADTDGDGLPDTRSAEGTGFVDTDGDGLPDAREE